MTRWADDTEVPVGDDATEAFTLPARYYTDPEVLEREREEVFAGTWQYAGDVGRVAEPGDYHACDVAGNGVVVARDREGELRAFHNVCPHRGSRIVDEGADGNARLLQCPYHGWTYRLDGALYSAPNFDADVALDCDASALREVAVDTVGPMVFVALAGDPAPREPVPGDVASALEPYAVDEFERVRTVEWTVECNWKAYVDNYLECDHCHLNHPSFVDSLDMAGYKIEARERHVVQRGEMGADSAMDAADEAADGSGTDGTGFVDEAARGRYFSAWVWPNLTIDVTPRSFEVNRIEPIDPGHTVLAVDYYGRNGEATDEWEDGFEFSCRVMREDVELCERQHAGLSSGVFGQGRLGPDEHGVHRFQTLLADRLDA